MKYRRPRPLPLSPPRLPLLNSEKPLPHKRAFFILPRVTSRSNSSTVIREAASCGHAETHRGYGVEYIPAASHRSHVLAFSGFTCLRDTSSISEARRSFGAMKIFPY